MRKFLLSIVLLTLQVAVTSAEQAPTTPSFVLLPSGGDGVAVSGGARLSFGEFGGSAGLDIFGPIRETKNGWLFYDFGFSTSLDEHLDVGATSVYAGLVYRYKLNERSILGFNAYVDGGRQSGDSDFMGLASLGVEYENRFDEQQGFIQLGGNAYFAFDDYTDIAKYGRLSSAPRNGLDAYASYGRDFNGYGLRGTVSAFNYSKTDSANALTGYRADLELEYWRGLPVGMTTVFGLGVRDDNRSGVDPAIVASAKLNWTFGNRSTGTVPTHDCAVVRDAKAEARIDCGEAVIRSIDGPVFTKGGQIAPDVVETRRLVRINPPRRHLGFGTPFTPIEYADVDPTLQLIKNSGSTDGTFTFTSTAAGLEASLTTVGGIAQGARVTLTPGTVTITETSIPAGWALSSIVCTGATSVTPDVAAATVNLELADGDSATCTFNNNFTPPVSSVQIVKSVIGDTAPAAAFTFDGSDNALDIVLNGAGGTETISGTATALAPGTYTIDETSLPAGFTFSSASCTGATFTQTAAGVSVTLADGDAAVCTIQNSFGPPSSSLTILKQTNGDAAPVATSFTFDGSDDALDVTLMMAAGASQSATSGPITLDPGTYTLREVNLPDFWTLTGLSCDNGAAVDFPNGQVTVDLANGDNVTCTYTNTFESPGPTGTIQLVKRTTGFAHGARDFVFSSPTGALNQTLSVAAGSQQTVTGEVILLPVGTHEITEAAGGGFVMQSIQCDDGSPTNTGTRTATVDLADGENVICTYINNNPTDPNDPGGPVNEPGRLIIEKRISGDCYGDYNLGFDITANSRVIGQATAPTCADGTATTEFTLGTGTFTISEANLPPGWSVDSLVCDGGGNTVTLADFDIKSCVIENVYDDTNVPAQTSLTIVKQTVGPIPAPATDFSFQAFAGTSNFSIPVPEGLSQRGEHFINATPGTTYRMRENPPADWTAVRVSCQGGATGRMVGGRPFITATLAQGEQAICFVDNEYTGTPVNSGTVTIVKQTVDGAFPAVFDSFNFTSSAGPLNTSIPVQANGTSSSGPIIVEAGSIVLRESRQSDWDLTSLSCSNGATVDLAAGTVTFDIADQENVTCTYVNTYAGGGGGGPTNDTLTFTLAKQLTGTPNPPPTNFSVEWAVTDDNGTSATTTETIVGGGSVNGSVELTGTGTMVLSEVSIPNGFSLEDIWCSQPHTVDLGAQTVTLSNLANGGDVYCRFTNTFVQLQPRLTIVKNTAGDAALATEFSVQVNSFSPRNFTVPAGSNQTATPYSAQSFAPGNYTITEGALPADWAMTSMSCDDGSAGDLANQSVSITLDFGDAVTCTMENTYTRPANTGTITFVPALDNQTTDGNGNPYVFNSNFSYFHSLNGNNFDQSGVGEVTGYTVNAGSYTIQQPDYGLFTLGQSNLVVGENYLDRIECTDGTNSVTNSVSVNIAAGQDVVCTFYNVMTNVDNTMGWITVRKAVLEVGAAVAPVQDVSFSSATAGLAQTISVGGGTLLGTGARIRVAAGSHTITEDSLPAGWDFDSVSCTSPDSSTFTSDVAGRSITVNLAALDRATCTFVNRYAP